MGNYNFTPLISTSVETKPLVCLVVESSAWYLISILILTQNHQFVFMVCFVIREIEAP